MAAVHIDGVLQASSTIAVPPVSGRTALVGFNVGPQGEVYFVSALGKLDYETRSEGFAIFPKTVPDAPQSYRVQCSRDDVVELDVTISNERFNIHLIQPIGDELLLACARSVRRSATDFERNGRIYGRDGTLRREFLLGDGIERIQSTSNGQIWCAYFDEGVFGNYGWREPVGASGLVAWNAEGEKIYEFDAPTGFDTMADCYALNVAGNDDVWCCYYTDFPLVRIQHRKVTSAWRSPVRGSHAFAVANGHVLFAGDYDDPHSMRLVKLGANEKAKVVGTFRPGDENGERLSIERMVGRGSKLYALSGETVHVIDANDVIARR